MVRSPTAHSTARRLLILAVTTALGALVALLTAPSAQAAYCGITWGSLPKGTSGAAPASNHLTDVRAGRHACYDRLVVDLAGATGFDAYDVRYVTRVTQDGSGAVVPLRGGAALRIVVHANPYDQAGHVTYAPTNRSELVNTTGYRTFRQVAWAGGFEGQTTIGLGVRARLPFRAFTVPGPAGSGIVRVVVDVAHLW
jgi:hypothetical protein